MPDADPPLDLVTIATCGDVVESSMLRAFLEDQGLLCYVQGENHRSMLGFLGRYIEINVMVPRVDARRARELVDDFRASAEPVDDDPDGGDDEPDAAADDDTPAAARPALEPPGVVDIDRPGRLRDRRPMVAVGMALMFGLGTGHFYVRAPVRGAVIAIVELATILLVGFAPIAAVAVHLSARVLDAVGSVVHLGELQRSAAATALPAARTVPTARRGGGDGRGTTGA